MPRKRPCGNCRRWTDRGQFCSKRCREMLERVCSVCKQTFYIHRRDLLKEKKYCSRACADTARSAGAGGPYLPQREWRCEHCGELYKAWPYEVASGRRYCSMKCRDSARKDRYIKSFTETVNKKGPIPEHLPELGPCWLRTEHEREDSDRRYDGHKIAWQIHNGPVEYGVCVCHRCDNPLCVNPEHLFLSDNRGNTADRVAKGRSKGAYKGHLHHNAKTSEKQAKEIIRLSKQGKFTQKEIAQRVGTTVSIVFDIRHRNTWKHLSRD